MPWVSGPTLDTRMSTVLRYGPLSGFSALWKGVDNCPWEDWGSWSLRKFTSKGDSKATILTHTQEHSDPTKQSRKIKPGGLWTDSDDGDNGGAGGALSTGETSEASGPKSHLPMGAPLSHVSELGDKHSDLWFRSSA